MRLTLSLIPAFLLLTSGCATDSQAPIGALDIDGDARSTWVCEDAVWNYGDTITDDSCFAEEGANWFEAHSEIVCDSETTFTWQIGRIQYECELYGSANVFTCLYFEDVVGRSGYEEDNDYVLVGRFVTGGTAVGTFKFTNDIEAGSISQTCSIDHDFMAAVR